MPATPMQLESFLAVPPGSDPVGFEPTQYVLQRLLGTIDLQHGPMDRSIRSSGLDDRSGCAQLDALITTRHSEPGPEHSTRYSLGESDQRRPRPKRR